MEGSAWLSLPVHRTWLWYFSKPSNTQLSPSRFHPFLWLPISSNKHVNSGTTVLSFLGRPKEPRTCRLATQVHVISGLRNYNRARLDIAAASTALNRVAQILPLWVQCWTESCDHTKWIVYHTPIYNHIPAQASVQRPQVLNIHIKGLNKSRL
jgi:hypothetical protein